jgi:hypothetical protein
VLRFAEPREQKRKQPGQRVDYKCHGHDAMQRPMTLQKNRDRRLEKQTEERCGREQSDRAVRPAECFHREADQERHVAEREREHGDAEARFDRAVLQ